MTLLRFSLFAVLISLIAVPGIAFVSGYVPSSPMLADSNSLRVSLLPKEEVYSATRLDQAAPSLIVSDQFVINGTAGVNLCDRINFAQVDADKSAINAGLIHVSFSANQSVNFWILNQTQYFTWSNAASCSSRLGSPSILTLASRLDYDNSTVRIPRTDDYYFAFDNLNPGPVSVLFVGDYPASASTTTATSNSILNAQFLLDGTKGTKFGCIYTAKYQASLNPGEVSVSYISTSLVDFWVLNQTQYTAWLGAMSISCKGGQTSPSVNKQINSNSYSGVAEIPSRGTFYFIFSNPSQNPVFIRLLVGYATPTTSTSSAANILQQLPMGSQLQQVLGAAGTGGSLILGWLFKTRKRRFLSNYLSKIDSTFNAYATNRAECRIQLERMKDEVTRMLKSGKLDEAHFTILDGKITQYLTELRQN